MFDSNSLIIIVGPRLCGKTTMLNHICKTMDGPFVVDMDRYSKELEFFLKTPMIISTQTLVDIPENIIDKVTHIMCFRTDNISDMRKIHLWAFDKIDPKKLHDDITSLDKYVAMVYDRDGGSFRYKS